MNKERVGDVVTLLGAVISATASILINEHRTKKQINAVGQMIGNDILKTINNEK